MKKLIAMLAVVGAAVAAQADLVLYWGDVDSTASGYTYNRTLLYTTTEAKGTSAAWTTPTSAVQGWNPSGTASLPEYTLSGLDTSSLFFYVALAQYDSSAKTYTTQAVSTLASYSDLYKDGYIRDTPDGNTWTAASFSVPEPTSGLLLCLGAALLVLRRKVA